MSDLRGNGKVVVDQLHGLRRENNNRRILRQMFGFGEVHGLRRARQLSKMCEDGTSAMRKLLVQRIGAFYEFTGSVRMAVSDKWLLEQ